MSTDHTTDTHDACPGCWDENCSDCNAPEPPAHWNSRPSQIHGRLTNQATAKQVNFLVSLGMAEDDARKLSRSDASDAIDRLKKARDAKAVTDGPPASDKQTSYLLSLLDQHDVAAKLDQQIRESIKQGKMTKRLASQMIDVVLNAPRRSKPRKGSKVLEDGMYRDDNGNIYKVYHTVHGANQQVAKQLITTDEPGEGYFEYVGKRPLQRLTPDHKMTLKQAKEFGAVYGVCCVCAATLTNEDSIEAGIGPVCSSKF